MSTSMLAFRFFYTNVAVRGKLTSQWGQLAELVNRDELRFTSAFYKTAFNNAPRLYNTVVNLLINALPLYAAWRMYVLCRRSDPIHFNATAVLQKPANVANSRYQIIGACSIIIVIDFPVKFYGIYVFSRIQIRERGLKK